MRGFNLRFCWVDTFSAAPPAAGQSASGIPAGSPFALGAASSGGGWAAVLGQRGVPTRVYTLFLFKKKINKQHKPNIPFGLLQGGWGLGGGGGETLERNIRLASKVGEHPSANATVWDSAAASLPPLLRSEGPSCSRCGTKLISVTSFGTCTLLDPIQPRSPFGHPTGP